MNLFSVPSAVARAIGSLCLTKPRWRSTPALPPRSRALEPSPT